MLGLISKVQIHNNTNEHLQGPFYFFICTWHSPFKSGCQGQGIKLIVLAQFRKLQCALYIVQVKTGSRIIYYTRSRINSHTVFIKVCDTPP